MATIEERAKEYVPNVFGPNYVELPARGGGFFLRALREAYIAGAKEQKSIDIEKACEWLGNYLMEIGYPDDWLRDSLNIKSGKERFIKAMEE